MLVFFFFKQKTAYEMRISDWSSECALPISGKLVFPGNRHLHRPMSENALGYLLNRAGYHGRHVPHGFRAAFSTIMNEWAKVHGRPDDREVIDLMLAHVPTNKVEGAYNRAAYMERRRELAIIWAELEIGREHV